MVDTGTLLQITNLQHYIRMRMFETGYSNEYDNSFILMQRIETRDHSNRFQLLEFNDKQISLRILMLIIQLCSMN